MEFDWARAIDRNREQLLDIVARLFVFAGIRTGCVVAALPRGLHLRILAMLRPAEYAARRLIATAACKLVAVTMRRAGKRGGDGAKPPSRPTAETLPAFPLFDPFKPYRHPWLEDGGDSDKPGWGPRDCFDPDKPVDAKSLCRRIVALERALQDLEGQAKRLARWRARRGSETCTPKRWSPMRPGHPPGWRRRPKTAVEEVLKECNFLAHDVWDTS